MTRRRTRPQATGEIPRWKLAVATGLLVAVAVAAVAVALWRGVLSPSAGGGEVGADAVADASPGGGAGGAAPGAEGTPDAGGAAGIDGSGAPGATPSAAEGATSSATAAPRDAHPKVTRALRAALRSWESFARSGDLADVEGAFVAGGPQHRQFRREARDGRAGVADVPAFSLRALRRVGPVRDGRREAVARVALTGDDGVPDVREWVFVLQRDAGRWRVWTVVDPADRD